MKKPIISTIVAMGVTLVLMVTISGVTWGIHEASKPSVKNKNMLDKVNGETSEKYDSMKELDQLQRIVTKLQTSNKLTLKDIKDLKSSMDTILENMESQKNIDLEKINVLLSTNKITQDEANNMIIDLNRKYEILIADTKAKQQEILDILAEYGYLNL